MFGIPLLEVNWSNISADWGTWLTTGYTNVVGDWFYPLVFLGFIGYVYCVNRSALSAAALICIIFGIFSFTGVFANADEFSALASLIATVVFAGLFVYLFTKNRRK